MNWYGEIFRKVHWDYDNPSFLKEISENFDPEKIREHALTFDKQLFKNKIKQYVEEKWEVFQNNNK